MCARKWERELRVLIDHALVDIDHCALWERHSSGRRTSDGEIPDRSVQIKRRDETRRGQTERHKARKRRNERRRKRQDVNEKRQDQEVRPDEKTREKG